ncbi:hypothetical protein JOC78_000069 [Bacillus ectoiniformans]|uniref:hypothetical protein n=1 Tax=Bacillus ectoiniformans TaxID=1494429 RepID=UPI0019579A36|nr:hypothetical protein [Bacillus ectoiniformans]MBM7647148.1 hypothetical protein [Bacillus ectoiniformans]
MNIQHTSIHMPASKAAQPLVMKDGQVFNGKVGKILPQGMAEINVGGQTVIAQSEVPLQAGERYWFQVASTEGKLHLKVISPPAGTQADAGKLIETILLKMSLPLTEENKQLAGMLMKDHTFLTKELITKASEWVKAGQADEGLQVIKAMIDRSLPFTKDVFQSLLAARSPVSISQQLEELNTLLKGLPEQPPAVQETLKLLTALQSPLEKSAVLKLFTSIYETLMSKETAPAAKSPALDILKSFGILPSAARQPEEALQQIVKQWAVEPKNAPISKGMAEGFQETAKQPSQALKSESVVVLPNATVREPIALFKEAAVQWLKDPVNKQNIHQLQQALQQLAKGSNDQIEPKAAEEIKQLMTVVSKTGATQQNIVSILHAAVKFSLSQNDSGQALRQFGQLFNKDADQLIQMVKNETARIESRPLQALPRKDAVFHQLLLTAEGQLRSDLQNKEALTLIKQNFQLLGTDLENRLSSRLNQINEIESTLKPHLLRLMNETAVPMTVRESAEQLIGRMNAQQLLSADTGQLQQLVMQVPMQLFGFQTDLTLQWSGKKKEDGKLDADFCRVLFYLQLEYMNETVVDMQVQNRMVNVQVYNDTPNIKLLAEPMIPNVKAGLEKIGYHLSAIQFKAPEKEYERPIVQMMSELPYTGVDLRI